MPEPASTNSDTDEISDSEDFSENLVCLPDNHPLQSSVPILAARGLQAYNSAMTTAAPPAPSSPPLESKPHSRLRLRNQATRNPMPPSPPDPVVFACPFYRHNPTRYHDCTWKADLGSIQRSIEHVVVYHHAPIYCAVCFGLFGSGVQRDDHVRARACPRREYTAEVREALEGATEDRVEALLRLSSDSADAAGSSGELDVKEVWFRMWDLLFPRELRPETPYLLAPEEREVVALRQFWYSDGLRVLRWMGFGVGVKDGTGKEHERQVALETVKALQASVLKYMVEEARWNG